MRILEEKSPRPGQAIGMICVPRSMKLLTSDLKEDYFFIIQSEKEGKRKGRWGNSKYVISFRNDMTTWEINQRDVRVYG